MSWTRASSVPTGRSGPHGDRRALWQGERRGLLPNGGSEGLLGVRAHGDGGA